MKIPSIITYTAVSALLIVWWGLAFRSEPTHVGLPKTQEHSHKADDCSLLSSFERNELKEALSGNYNLMAALMLEWDIDAQHLAKQEVKDVRRLSSEALLESQLIARKLQRYRRVGEKRFLPQTYVAASFLLTLAEPKQIVALPQGFRRQTALYSPNITSQIPVDLDRHHSESLYLCQPDLAFIAPYSHPSTVEALRNQGIKLFSIQALDTFEDICHVLTQIGEATERSDEALLLRTFMEAAMLAIDNRLACQKEKSSLPKSLYVSYHSAFSLPTKKNLTGQLLIRMGVMEHMEELEAYAAQNQWSFPIDQEKIVNYKPECLIISSDNAEGLKQRIDNDPAFAGLRNSCGRIVYVNEDIINSPSQYIVLAYYDLVQALLQP